MKGSPIQVFDSRGKRVEFGFSKSNPKWSQVELSEKYLLKDAPNDSDSMACCNRLDTSKNIHFSIFAFWYPTSLTLLEDASKDSNSGACSNSDGRAGDGDGRSGDGQRGLGAHFSGRGNI